MQSSETRQMSIITGAVTGLVATAPLIAISYAGGQLLMLPQPFIELFDRLTRVLPGAIITFGIDTMVSIFSRLPGVSTDVASKAAEQSLAVAQFLILGAILGAVIALLYNGVNRGR